MEKFIKKQTTVAVFNEEWTELPLPAVTLCNSSGFKNDHLNARLKGKAVRPKLIVTTRERCSEGEGSKHLTSSLR
jgi:hypothetical protein